jgi:hypothetical protein
MTPRDRFLATFRDGHLGCPARWEDVRDDLLFGWSAHQLTARCRLDRWQCEGPPGIDLAPRPGLERAVASPEQAREWYARFEHVDRGALDPAAAAHRHQHTWPLALSCWRGVFQTFGVRDGATLTDHLYFLADHPDLAAAMVAHLAQLVSELVEPALAACEYDCLWFGEPIASHHAPVISPTLFARVAGPFYTALIALGRRHGIELFVFESYGQVEALLPVVLAWGVNVLCLRHARAAGTDYRRLRARLGPDVGLLGGVDARALAAGPAAIDAEVDQVVAPLLAAGRYQPMLDDRLRESTDPEAFVHYSLRVERLLAAG